MIMGLTLAMTLIFEFSRSYVILTIWWPRSSVRIYQIMTGVTSDVGVPSTHLVYYCIGDFDPNWAFPDCNSCLNSPISPYCFSRWVIKFQGHMGQKITNCGPNWAFLDLNSSLTSLMDLKWCTKLDVVQKRCPTVFQGHPSNLKVTWDKILPILTRIEHFGTVTRVWIHWWIWNDAQSLM